MLKNCNLLLTKNLFRLRSGAIYKWNKKEMRLTMI